MKNKLKVLSVIAVLAFTLIGCKDKNSEEQNSVEDIQMEETTENTQSEEPLGDSEESESLEDAQPDESVEEYEEDEIDL